MACATEKATGLEAKTNDNDALTEVSVLRLEDMTSTTVTVLSMSFMSPVLFFELAELQILKRRKQK